MFDRQDSACSLQWTIQMKDKQIAVISEKLNAHLALFSSVGKEVAAVKQVLGNVKCLVGDKENVVSDLKGKVEKISVLEKDFVGMEGSTSKHDSLVQKHVDFGILENNIQDPTATPMYLPMEFLKTITCDFSKEQELGRGGRASGLHAVNRRARPTRFEESMFLQKIATGHKIARGEN
ncbi:hypothetical protein OsI_33539 [Oryza sativa Indica Group]|uniref:Uncharacterized protein n=1 Tax=Oryza sativa subsp. indica TaxID=39946 RepID=B8BGS8_ORYSI|nr:hypothetical protein OsI_33539 [Oryza sativa Indica Group]